MKGFARSMARAAKTRAAIVKQTLKITNAQVSVAGASGVGFGTVVIGGLPQGNILFLGAVSYLQFNSQSDADVQAAYDGDYSIGTAPTADATLSGSEVDIIPSTALGAATAGLSPLSRGSNATQVILNNTDGSLELNLNLLIDDANISGAATFLANGTLDVAYIVLGDD